MKFLDFVFKKIKRNKRTTKNFFSRKTTFKRRRKKFSFFKLKFNFRNVSLSDYYNKGNKLYLYYFII
jgi:hypothetical protein